MKFIGTTLLLAATAISLSASTVTLDFEGVGNNNAVADYYNGGVVYVTQGPSLTAGANYGVDFSNNGPAGIGFYSTTALTNVASLGSGNTSNEPSPNTTITWFSGAGLEMDVAGGFTSLSFFYSSPNSLAPGDVTVFDALGNDIGFLAVPNNGPAPACASAPGAQAYCNWTQLTISTFTGSGIGASVLWTGTPNFFLFDNISFDQYVAPPVEGGDTPEPGTMFLLGSALIGLGFGAKKFKLKK